MITMKQILHFFDFVFGCVSGFSLIELLPIIVTGHVSYIFSNVDNGIKISSAVVGLVYFIFRIYFYYHKSKEEISFLKQQTIDLELKNKSNEVKNYLFSKDFADMKTEEFENSKKRLKK